MEIILLLVAMAASFFIGLVKGYGLNLQDNDTQTYMNVIFREMNGATYVYEYGTDRYILQEKDAEAAKKSIMKMYPSKDIIIIDGGKHEDDSV